MGKSSEKKKTVVQTWGAHAPVHYG